MSKNLRFHVMWKSDITAEVEVNYKEQSVTVKNFTDDIMIRPFGINESPTMDDLDEFFESRCFPRERDNCKQILNDLDVMMYDPYLIVKKTHGRQLEDYMWIQFDGEELDYEKDIKLRD